jgi:hypothetical protein
MNIVTTTSYRPEPSPHSIARAAGFFWLMTMATSAFAYFISGKFFIPGDAAATATNVTAHESLYRLAFTANLIATACYLLATLLVYVLFKPVNKNVSLLGAFFSLVGCAVGAIGCLLFLGPVSVLNGAAAGFTLEQLQAQALTLLTLSARANDIGLVFFGLHVLCVGYLIRRSTFLPRILGVLLTFTGLCYLANSFANFLSLGLEAYLMPFVAAGGLGGEGALSLWLLIAGVNDKRWNSQAEIAGACCAPRAVNLEPIAG